MRSRQVYERHHRHGVVDPRADVADPPSPTSGNRADGSDDPTTAWCRPSITPQSISASRCCWYSPPGLVLLRHAGARQLVEHGEDDSSSARSSRPARTARRSTAPAGEAGNSAIWFIRSMRQVPVLDADMDVHGADQEPPDRRADVGGQLLVALAMGGLLRQPGGEGVGRRGDDLQVVGARDLPDRAAQAARPPAGLRRPRRRPASRPRSGSA